MKHKLLLIYSWFIRLLLFIFPDIPFIMRFRGWLYGLGMKKCGKNFQVTHDANIKTLERTTIGNNVFIGNGSILLGSGYICIFDDVQIGPHCTLVSGNHKFQDGVFVKKESNIGTIILNKGSWVGANCVLAVNASLPQGSVLGACSFLSKNMDKPNCVYGGVPAKFIKEL